MAMEPGHAPLTIPEPQVGQPEITMAPLIDVVFLLLIFFMVTTVFPDNQGLLIEKPATHERARLPDEPMAFQITDNGEIRFAEQTVSAEDVERLVRERLLSAPQTSMLLRVDRRATAEVLIRVMDACKLGGAAQIGIATDAVQPDR